MRSGFTLIELLVVISIIAVLAAMLLPAIKLVKDSANATRCSSNLHQFALSINTYSNDNDGYLVSGSIPGVGNWVGLLLPYLQRDSADDLAYSRGARESKIFHGCPTLRQTGYYKRWAAEAKAGGPGLELFFNVNSDLLTRRIRSGDHLVA